MNCILKCLSLLGIVIGVVGTVYLAGFSSVIVTCAPFLLFGGAVLLGRHSVSGACTVLAISLAVTYGVRSYYEAFTVHRGGEVDGVAILVVPLVQGVLAFVALLVAFGEWVVYKYRSRELRVR